MQSTRRSNCEGLNSWIVLFASMIIHITLPSITATYGILLGYKSIDRQFEFDLRMEGIALVPIFYTAFLCLADPWTRILINSGKESPRLIGLAGLCFMLVGVHVTESLLKDILNIYWFSLRAGALMGIGSSFILVQTEIIICRHFNNHLRLAQTLEKVALSIGFIYTPGFMVVLVSTYSLHVSAILISLSLIPTMLSILLLHHPEKQCKRKPYIISESQNEQELSNLISQPVDTRESNIYRKQNTAETQRIFNTTKNFNNFISQYWHNLLTVKSFKFFLASIAWISCQTGALFIWIFLPFIAVTENPLNDISEGLNLVVIAGIGTLIPNLAFFWELNRNEWSLFLFGAASWLGSFVFLILSCTDYLFSIYMIFSFIGGVSLALSSICLESVLVETLGFQPEMKYHLMLSTIVGLCILLCTFIKSPLDCLKLTSGIQFVGGSYWILAPLIRVMKKAKIVDNIHTLTNL